MIVRMRSTSRSSAWMPHCRRTRPGRCSSILRISIRLRSLEAQIACRRSTPRRTSCSALAKAVLRTPWPSRLSNRCDEARGANLRRRDLLRGRRHRLCRRGARSSMRSRPRDARRATYRSRPFPALLLVPVIVRGLEPHVCRHVGGRLLAAVHCGCPCSTRTPASNGNFGREEIDIIAKRACSTGPGHQLRRALPRRHRVRARALGPVRRRAHHVPRPGADRHEADRLRPGRHPARRLSHADMMLAHGTAYDIACRGVAASALRATRCCSPPEMATRPRSGHLPPRLSLDEARRALRLALVPKAT